MDKTLGEYVFDIKTFYSVSFVDGKEVKGEAGIYKVVEDGILWLSRASSYDGIKGYQVVAKVSRGTLVFTSKSYSYPCCRYYMTESYFNSLPK